MLLRTKVLSYRMMTDGATCCAGRPVRAKPGQATVEPGVMLPSTTGERMSCWFRLAVRSESVGIQFVESLYNVKIDEMR